jgi:hypothetical protein
MKNSCGNPLSTCRRKHQQQQEKFLGVRTLGEDTEVDDTLSWVSRVAMHGS